MSSDIVITSKSKQKMKTNTCFIYRTMLLDLTELKYLPVKYL